MPYCSKCGRFYYVTSRSCSTCGELFLEQVEKAGDTGSRFQSARRPERDKRCPYCNSTGKVDGPAGGEITVTCPVCRGKRYNLIPENWLWCKECDGTGEYIYGNGVAKFRKPCLDCKGTGWMNSA